MEVDNNHVCNNLIIILTPQITKEKGPDNKNQELDNIAKDFARAQVIGAHVLYIPR